MDALTETLAVALYRRLDHDPSKPVSTFTLARQLLLTDIERPVTMIGSLAGIFWRHQRRYIAIKRSVPIPLARFFAAHELAHVLFEQEGYTGADLEEQCDRLGAALMAPRPAVEALRRAFGHDIQRIAAVVGSSQTCAALRLGEAGGAALAVVSPSTVRTRGAEGAWPAVSTLRKWVRRPPRGLAKTRLTDDRRRVVLRVHDHADTRPRAAW